jgi:hypothetical protein
MIDEDFQTVKVGRNSNTEGEYLDGEVDDVKYYKGGGPPTNPPEKPTITGPQGGDAGQSLTYTFSAVDPDGDDVRFIIDWGDGDIETTIYVPSGSDTSKSHTWSPADTYTIIVYAEDENGLQGPAETFDVVIPRNKVNTQPFLRFLQNFPNMFTILKYVLGL